MGRQYTPPFDFYHRTAGDASGTLRDGDYGLSFSSDELDPAVPTTVTRAADVPDTPRAAQFFGDRSYRMQIASLDAGNHAQALEIARLPGRHVFDDVADPLVT